MNIRALIKSLLHRRFATLLLVLQLALTLGLVVNTSIMALDTNDKLTRNMGFVKEELLVVKLMPTSGAFRDKSFYRSVMHQDIATLSALPGVKSVSQLNQLPIQRGGHNGTVTDIKKQELAEQDRYLNFVPFLFSNYAIFETLGLDLVEGRLFDEGSPQMRDQNTVDVVITQSLAKRIYGEQSAIGQQLNMGKVIGVVSDFVAMPGRPEGKQYSIFFNEDLVLLDYPLYYLIRVKSGEMKVVADKVSDVLLNVNPERDIGQIFTMDQHHIDFYQQDTGLVNLFLMLCVLMLIVTAISSFAHAQFHISKQKRLIGIRRALGATKQDIVLYVLSEHWLVTVVGAVVGIGVIIGINIGLSTQIKISQPDFLLYLGAVMVVFLSGTLATWIPALRTSSIPPVVATRTV